MINVGSVNILISQSTSWGIGACLPTPEIFFQASTGSSIAVFHSFVKAKTLIIALMREVR